MNAPTEDLDDREEARRQEQERRKPWPQEFYDLPAKGNKYDHDTESEQYLHSELQRLRQRERKLVAALATAWSIGSCHKLPEFHVLNQWRELINS